tara:strand:+ start:301 stop:1080 length:780 start_codon:yes stop_codon:yes gene_type:complete
MPIFVKTKMLAPVIAKTVDSAVQSWPDYKGGQLDRTKFVSSSSTGKCERQVYFASTADPLTKGKFPWGYAQRGHSHEAWVVEQLRSSNAGITFMLIGDQQVSFFAGDQSGTPDGMAKSATQTYLLEFKSIDPRTNINYLPKEVALKQCVQNMDLIEHCYDMKLDGALLLYSDCSDYSLMYEFWIDRNQPEVDQMMLDLEDRAVRINNATSPDQLEPEGIYNGDCKNCSYKAICSATVEKTKLEKMQHDKLSKTGGALFG